MRQDLLGVDLGRQQVVDERIGRVAVRRALRDGVVIGPDLAALLAEHVLHLRHVAMQLGRIAGPAHGHPGIAIAHRGLIVGIDAEEMRLDREQQLLGVGQLLLVVGVEGIAEIFERVADGGELIVVNHDAAGQAALSQVPELLPAGRVLRHLLGVDDEAGGAPVLRHGIDGAVDGAFGGESADPAWLAS